MKKRWIFWWICNIFWGILFALGSAIVWLREVDGTGTIQTAELKLVAFIVLLLAFIIPLAIQVIWLIINLITTRKNNTYAQYQ